MDDLTISPKESATENPNNTPTIPQITFNVADEDEEYLHEDELDGGIWKGPPGSMGDDVDDDFDPAVLECIHTSDQYDINGVPIPLNKPQEQHVSSSPSTPTGSYSHIRRGSMKLIFPKLFHWRKLTDKKHLLDARNKIQRLTLRSSTSTNVVGHLDDNYMEHHGSPNHLSPTSITLNENYLGDKRLSVDSVGILKHSADLEQARRQQSRHKAFKTLGLNRKAVSFSVRDNHVQYFDKCPEEFSAQLNASTDNTDSSEIGSKSKTRKNEPSEMAPPTPQGMPQLSGKSLVPVFVFPGKRPTYAEDFKDHVIMLESLEITEDFCLIGNIRVNMSHLRAINQQQEAKNKTLTVKQKASVFALYTFDSWKNYKETKAMVVNAVKHPALKKFDTHAMRFWIDCDEMEIGDTVEFTIWCSDKRTTVKQGTKITRRHKQAITEDNKDCTTVINKYKDDNDGNYYKARCTKKLNPWAEKAARELKNFTPIVKFQKNYN
jgi:hypothetical protein